MLPVPDTWQQARTSHEFFHQSAKVLKKQFNLPISEAKAIIQTCPDCQQIIKGPTVAVNPRGLQSLQLWHTHVTHIPEFGKLKYVHVSVDTYSMAVCMTALSGETSQHVHNHFRHAFVTLGIPQKIKTDNGLAYVSQSTGQFFRKWGVQHVTGIPHSPTGQAIIERTHQTLKHYLQKQKEGEYGETPVNTLMKVQYMMNFLRLAGEDVIPPIVKHMQAMSTGMTTYKEQLKVLVKNKEGKWEGSFQLVTWGRG